MTTSVEGPTTTRGWIADDSTFGARLALVRQRMGWTNVKEAATACGLPTENWRRWERGETEPRRIVTIAMTIATRAGCDYLWLVHGPGRGQRIETRFDEGDATLSSRNSDVRVVAIGGSHHATRSSDVVTTRPVRQTRPLGAVMRRPLTAMAL